MSAIQENIYYDNKIIFSTRQLLLFLQSSQNWSVYETFSTVPLHFLQLQQSMEFITLEMLLGPIVYSEINVEKPILESSDS